ncbi:hypothetical protein PRIPAC_72396, partial [Pristionchus pacificus]
YCLRSRSRSRGYNNNDQRRNGDNYRRDRSRSRSRGYNNNDHGRSGDGYRDRSRTPGYNNDDQRRNGDNYIRDRSRSRSRGYKNNDNRRDRYDNRDRSRSRSRGNGRSRDYDRERSRSPFQHRHNNDKRRDRYDDGDRSRSTVRDRSVQRGDDRRGRSRSPNDVAPLFALPRNEGDRRTPTPIRELPAPTKRQRRDRSISREWNPPPLRRKGFMNDNDTRSPSSSSRQRQKKRGRRRSSSPLEVVDDRRGGRRESNSSSQYIPPDPRSGRRDTSPVRPSYGWKTSSREAMETGGVGLSESRPIVIDDDEGRGGGRETRNSCNPILSAFSAIREMLPPNNQSQKESAGKAKAAKPAVDQSIVDQAPKGSKAKPLVNGCLLSFSLELYSNYEEIVDHFERLRAAVTVVRRPMSARPGACVLELPHEIATTILLSRSPIRFGQNTVPLKSPAVVELSMEREGMDATKLEAEIEKQFGPIVQVVVDGRTKKKGWVMFADESSAARALAVGSLTCESTEGSIRFETVDEKKNGEGMWQLKEDRTWISHRMRAQRCRCMAATSKSNERTKWNEPEMRKVIEDQIRDEGDVLLVGGPIVGDLCLADVKQYFKSRFGVIAYEVEKPTVDDPGTFDINVKVRENGGFKSHSVVELLTVDHIISGHSIALGLVSSIDIVTTPVDPKLQRMMVIEFQKQFGAVIGFLEKGREEGRGRYRIVFMHLHHAARAHETLSVLVDRPFLPGMEQVIIHEVDHLKTWKEQKAKD